MSRSTWQRFRHGESADVRHLLIVGELKGLGVYAPA